MCDSMKSEDGTMDPEEEELNIIKTERTDFIAIMMGILTIGGIIGFIGGQYVFASDYKTGYSTDKIQLNYEWNEFQEEFGESLKNLDARALNFSLTCLERQNRTWIGEDKEYTEWNICTEYMLVIQRW